MRKYSNTDKLIMKTNDIFNIFTGIKSSGKTYPAENIEEQEIKSLDKKMISNLMRVNHSGEVSAQGLYIGHALLAKDENQKQLMLDMASEEKDHLDWCEKRINELGGKTSIFNPLWFTGSVAIGMLSSIRNNEQALGFIEETEKQVAEHLESHINKIPKEDKKTYVILKKMKDDEKEHGKTARNFGAEKVSKNLRKIMELTASIMKFASYRL